MEWKCENCRYSTDHKANWAKHLETKKHKRLCADGQHTAKCTKVDNRTSESHVYHICGRCGKQYKHKSGLSRHKMICYDEKDSETQLEFIEEHDEISKHSADIIKNQQQQIQQLQSLLEQSIESNSNTLNNILPKVGNTTNNINNQMTINVFLNEECRDAMNLTDFVKQIKLSTNDLQYTKDNGYVKGITNIFVKNLSEMPATSRPIHCSDKKTLQFYVKDENKWEKDSQNEKIDKSINEISQKQIQQIKEWESKHPNWDTSEKETSAYIDLLANVMGGTTDSEKETNLEGIKKKIGVSTDLNKVLE